MSKCDTFVWYQRQKMSYLQRRNGVYYFHKKVNKELEINRNSFIRKSLQTKCYTTAKQLASLLNYYANKYFSVGIIMTTEKMDEILFNYFQGSIEAQILQQLSIPLLFQKIYKNLSFSKKVASVY